MISSETRGSVAVVRMEHGKVNALDLELAEALAGRLAAVAESDAEALVVTGNGRAFSAGVDLFRVVDEGRSYLERFLPALDDAMWRLFSFPKPAVAAVDGHAIAGGCVLACAADLRIMAEGEGRIGLPEVAVGVPFPPRPLEVLRHALGTPLCQRLIYSGETFTGERALELGLVERLAPAEELVDLACAAAARLASGPAPAFQISKEQLRRPAVERAERAQGTTSGDILEAWCADETLAHIRAYLKRTVGRSS